MHAQTTPYSCGIAVACHVAARNQEQVAKYRDLPPEAVEKVQARVHDIASHTGLYWPQKLGTSTWALQSLLESATGVKYRRYLWIKDMYPLARAALDSGKDVVFYTGGSTLKLRGKLCHLDQIPRHVVSATGRGNLIDIFEPSKGRTWTMTWQHFLDKSTSCDKEPAFGYWPRVIMVLIPRDIKE
ncbi:MAG: hypothetical protein Q4D87_06830 [Actinomycetaceae bacterium]|nr:hypothetical protein [Actinomycetaceae bacterium]